MKEPLLDLENINEDDDDFNFDSSKPGKFDFIRLPAR